MTTETLTAPALQRLLAEVASHGTQHLVEVEVNLVQTTELLSEAINKLGASFMAIHHAVAQQQQELDILLELQDLPEASAEKIRAMRQQIAHEVNAVMTGLQFQDLTNQLIAGTVKRVNGLRDLLDALGSQGELFSLEAGQDVTAKLLDEVSQNLNSRSHALNSNLKKSVMQQHMGSGDIELF
ncbi:MAG: chemotaxis protein [Methylophilaceae bacterium]